MVQWESELQQGLCHISQVLVSLPKGQPVYAVGQPFVAFCVAPNSINSIASWKTNISGFQYTKFYTEVKEVILLLFNYSHKQTLSEE